MNVEKQFQAMTPILEKVHGEPARTWRAGLGVYLAVIAIGNLAWESVHLPLYTIWSTGTFREQAFAVMHCTLGDVLIAAITLAACLGIFGHKDWPQRRFWLVACVTVSAGLAYTIFSEWLNVEVRGSWAYSERMPVVSMLGLQIALSPLLQWIILPAAAFAIGRKGPFNKQ